MATIITYNEARTQGIINGTVVDGNVDGSGGFVLDRRDGNPINAGNVKGPLGYQGPERPLDAGRVSLFAGATAPIGWFICDGAAISRTDYAQLFTAIGTTYGAGNGSSTFNIPDFRGRVPVGLDSTQTEFDNLGEKGGFKTHSLTIAEMPAHTHTVLGYKGKDDSNFTGNIGRLQASDNPTAYDKQTQPTGDGAAHNNLQPYTTVNYIISIGIAGPQGGGVAAARYFTSKARGTTAARDTKYGVPATDAARVALANQKVVWFNTDLGWDESYYAVTATAGLIVLGLVAGATAGWYPIGEGPHIELDATAPLTVMANSLVGNYGNMRRKGGAAWFTSAATERIQVLKHGRYDIKAWTIQEGGSALFADYVLQVLAADGTTLLNGVSGGAFSRNTAFITRAHMECTDLIIAPNGQVAFKYQPGTIGGAISLHAGSDGGRGRLSVRYVGPPLTTD